MRQSVIFYLVVLTAAMQAIPGGDVAGKAGRTPEIMADAAYLILTKEPTTFTGNFVLDEEILRQHGVVDFRKYAVDPSTRSTDTICILFP